MFDLTPFDRMGRSLDTMKELDDFEKRFFGRPMPTFRTDIRETDSAYILEAELPGFRKEEIRATVKNNLLTISAEHNSLHEESDQSGGYLRRERSRGTFSRTFDITGVRADGIGASFENGILTVTLPKAEMAKDTVKDLEIQ